MGEKVGKAQHGASWMGPPSLGKVMNCNRYQQREFRDVIDLQRGLCSSVHLPDLFTFWQSCIYHLSSGVSSRGGLVTADASG